MAHPKGFEVILKSGQDADNVRDAMLERIKDKSVITLGEMYQLVGLIPKFYDNQVGWTDLDGSDIQEINEGFILNLPEPKDIS